MDCVQFDPAMWYSDVCCINNSISGLEDNNWNTWTDMICRLQCWYTPHTPPFSYPWSLPVQSLLVDLQSRLLICRYSNFSIDWSVSNYRVGLRSYNNESIHICMYFIYYMIIKLFPQVYFWSTLNLSIRVLNQGLTWSNKRNHEK